VIRVLSLFDGISCARVALDRLGYEVEYYASEVDRYAVQVAQKNWPDTVQLGDVRRITADMFPDGIDLLIGGSPCQDLSIAKAGRKGLDGERSGLFWEYVRIWRELRPRYFVLENVNSMPKEAKRIISETLGVEPIMIDAALVSGQTRKRVFWTNIPNVSLPVDKQILMSDSLNMSLPFRNLKPFCFLKSSFGMSSMKCILDSKSNTLTTSNTHNKMYLLNEDKTMMRTLTPNEFESLQCLPNNYTSGIANTHRFRCIGNAFNVEVVRHILSFMDKGETNDR
jgi:site-specific DNA-cytosine methylase